MMRRLPGRSLARPKMKPAFSRTFCESILKALEIWSNPKQKAKSRRLLRSWRLNSNLISSTFNFIDSYFVAQSRRNKGGRHFHSLFVSQSLSRVGTEEGQLP